MKKLKKFTSKKNHVELVSTEKCSSQGCMFVIKHLASSENAIEEARFLTALREKNLTVPAVVRTKGSDLVMEYIDGDNMCDIMERSEALGENCFCYADMLINWLSLYYKATMDIFGQEMCRGDSNLRNFLITKQGFFYSVDFEPDHYFIGKENDFGSICAYVITYNPPYTVWKREWIRYFATRWWDRFPDIRKSSNDCYMEQLEIISQRRKIVIPEEVKHLFLKK